MGKGIMANLWQKAVTTCLEKLTNQLILFGWETWIRTTIHGVRVQNVNNFNPLIYSLISRK